MPSTNSATTGGKSPRFDDDDARAFLFVDELASAFRFLEPVDDDDAVELVEVDNFAAGFGVRFGREDINKY